jgi:hypothetical protein
VYTAKVNCLFRCRCGLCHHSDDVFSNHNATE